MTTGKKMITPDDLLDAYKRGVEEATGSKWVAFSEREPLETGEPKLIVWNKGTERHLGVAWGTVERFRTDMEVAETDVLLYWMYLPDPEIQVALKD
jgi:hypothetical protein